MPNRLIDISGRIFGRLRVISHHKTGIHKGMWECVCECQTVVYKHSGDLRRGATKSCGCLNSENITTLQLLDISGQRFQGLLAIRREGRRRGRVAWLCLCDCGRYTKVVTSDLTSGNTQTCGCRCVSHGDPGQYILNSYQSRAMRTALEFSISKETFFKTIQLNCNYCGCTPSNILSQKKGNLDPNYHSFRWNGLDRIDSAKGYTEDNVVPCCKTCNELKSDKTREEFLSAIESIHRWQNR